MKWFKRIFDPMWAWDIAHYLRWQRSRNRRFMRVIKNVQKNVLKIHPEYKVSDYDEYFLASFAKRFVGEWATEVKRINADKLKKKKNKNENNR